MVHGRAPTAAECKQYQGWHRHAIKGWQHKGGHDSRDLWSLLQAGHTSDLCLCSSQRFLSALHKWVHNHPHIILTNRSPCLKALKSAVKRFQAERSFEGKVSLFQGHWNVRDPVSFAAQQSHLMRQHWRKHMFGKWLRGSRIDSTMAGHHHIVYSEKLVDSLRKHADKANGHEVAVMSGGIQTDAHFSKMGQGCAIIVMIVIKVLPSLLIMFCGSARLGII